VVGGRGSIEAKKDFPMNWLRRWAVGQIASNRGVVTEHRWDSGKGVLFINTEAGLIQFRPKDHVQLNSFRDKYLNRIVAVSQRPGKERRSELFDIYKEIRRDRVVRFRANVRTRVEGMLWSLRSLL